LRFFFAFFGVLFGIRFHGIRYWKFCFLWVDWVIFAHNKATRGRRPRGVWEVLQRRVAPRVRGWETGRERGLRPGMGAVGGPLVGAAGGR
jgi:hypothetical protein